MRKILVMALSALMITTIVGCAPKDGETNDNGNGTEENVTMDKMTYFGKVKSIVGNELELEIANEDVLGIVFEDEEKNENSEGESQPATALTPATEPDSTEVVSGDANKDKMKLEYTGEIEKLVIPGGVNIMELSVGKEGKISDIKDGSVIIIYTDKTSNSISKIDILE